jgi:hypothetical protein
MSIFDLKQSVGDLTSANDKMSRMTYEQHPPSRDVTGNNFPNGAIHIRFQCSGQKWWVPSRTYIRTRMSITKADGATQLDVADDVAPNMGLCANLYQSAEFRIADKTVSRIGDYMPQIDALETRLNKSKSWIDSVGNSTNWWESDITKRISDVSVDGEVVKNPQAVAVLTETRGAIGFDAAGNTNNNASYVAATGVITFTADAGQALPQDVRAVYPAGSFFVYTAGTTVATSVGIRMKVITGVNGAPAGNATSIVVERGLALDENGNTGQGNFSRITETSNGNPSRRIKSFEMTWQPPLSIFKIDHAMPAGKYELVLNPQTASEYKKRAIESLNADKVPGALGQFDVQIDDIYLYVATVDGVRADNVSYLLDLKDTRCQVDTITQSNFQQKNFDVSPSTYALTTCFQDERAGNLTQYSASKFKLVNNGELQLNRLFVNYAGQNKPSPDADPKFDVALDHTTQRYVDSMLNSGAYFDCGGAETIEEYHERGSYNYFSWPRDGTDRSTRVNVHFGFANAVANARVLLFDHSHQSATIQVRDGHVVSVDLEDV